MNLELTAEDQANGHQPKHTYTVHALYLFEKSTGHKHDKIVRLCKSDIQSIIAKRRDEWDIQGLVWTLVTETRVRA